MVGDAGGSSSRRDFDQIMSATVEDTRDPAINNGQTNSKVIMAK